MNTQTFPKIAEALRAVAALLDEAAEGAARAPAAPSPLPSPPADAGAREEDDEPAAAPAPAPVQPTFEDAKGAVLNFARTLGAEETKKLLAGFGAQRVSEVPAEQWAAVIAAANRRLEKYFFEEQQPSVGANNHLPSERAAGHPAQEGGAA